jgi:flavin-binding protein dodecin
MSVAKTIEILSRSSESFEDAMKQGIAKAAETVDEMKQAWVMDQKLILDGDSISEYQVDLRVTFVVH